MPGRGPVPLGEARSLTDRRPFPLPCSAGRFIIRYEGQQGLAIHGTGNENHFFEQNKKHSSEPIYSCTQRKIYRYPTSPLGDRWFRGSIYIYIYTYGFMYIYANGYTHPQTNSQQTISFKMFFCEKHPENNLIIFR